MEQVKIGQFIADLRREKGYTQKQLAGLAEMSIWARVILIVCAVVVAIRGLVAAANLELEAGEYECPVCKRLFKPTMGEYIKGAHTFTRRKLKCPHCGAKKYCKYKISHATGKKSLDKEENK